MYQGALTIDFALFELMVTGTRDKNGLSDIVRNLLLCLLEERRWGTFVPHFERGFFAGEPLDSQVQMADLPQM